MTKNIWTLSTVLVLLTHAGCIINNNPEEDPGTGGVHDAGAVDGGAKPVPDGGLSTDGGLSDAGTSPDDAGTTPDDAGTLPTDAGTSPDDAGTTDAGVIATLRAITLSPENVQLVAQGSTATTQAFTVTGTYSDDHTEDVTSLAKFTIDNTQLGYFNGATFSTSTSMAGRGNVRARVGELSVTTPLTVRLEQKVKDSHASSSTVPAQPETLFSGAVDTARKPSIVYPNNGVMVPPNLRPLEIHFLPGPTTNTLFELSFSNALTDVRVYLRCYLPTGFKLPSGVSRGCIYTPSEQVWNFVANSNRGGQPVKLALRATDDSGAGTVGVSDPIDLHISRDSLKGNLYYFTTSNTGVVRYEIFDDFSSPPTPLVTGANISNTAVMCVGCHSVSRDGKKMVVGANGQNDGRIALLDLTTFNPSFDKVPLAQGGTRLSSFESWNPDSSRFVGAYGDSGATRFNLMLFNGTTGAFEGEIPNTGTSTNPVTHPDWSADGKTIAFTSIGIKGTLQRSYKGSIQVVEEQPGSAWGNPVTVVSSQSGKHRYAPAIAPDNSFLVYNESSCPSGSGDVHRDCNSEADPSARLWAAKLRTSSAPVELTRANAPGIMDGTMTNLSSGYAKWHSVVARGQGGSGRLMWMTFGSTRMYGLRQPAPGLDENPRNSLLWIAAVDPDKLDQGVDPSYPAFALPMQNLTVSNHLPQWLAYDVRDACAIEGEGCGIGGGAASCCNSLSCMTESGESCTTGNSCTCGYPEPE
ncbi:hypothetical protein F0U60_50025 [Archangium minus]|uniref:TolB protein n=1 Tax=Archangium minus TaxID=83450 RepID=A0ABY9X7K7_9BACT|nr:hypothetical protein F0U60_50025 [Archangium minus]